MASTKPRGISPALSQLEIRLDKLKEIRSDIDTHEAEVIRHEHAIEGIGFVLTELNATEKFCVERINELVLLAKEEGYSDEFINRFIIERCGRTFKI